jgi:hypothetical protein
MENPFARERAFSDSGRVTSEEISSNWRRMLEPASSSSEVFKSSTDGRSEKVITGTIM